MFSESRRSVRLPWPSPLPSCCVCCASSTRVSPSAPGPPSSSSRLPCPRSWRCTSRPSPSRRCGPRRAPIISARAANRLRKRHRTRQLLRTAPATLVRRRSLRKTCSPLPMSPRPCPSPRRSRAHPRRPVTRLVWQIGFAAYLAITALLLLRVLLGLALAVRLWRRAQPFATSETDLPVRSRSSLIDLRSPATVGHGILLPLEAIEWDDAALRRHARA